MLIHYRLKLELWSLPWTSIIRHFHTMYFQVKIQQMNCLPVKFVSLCYQLYKRNIPEGQWKVLAKAVFKKLENDNSPVLASIDKVLNHPGEVTVRWCSPCDRATPYYQAYFIPDPCKRGDITPASLKELLVKIGVTITCAPHHIRAHFENAPPEATPENVFNFYNTFYERIVQGPVCHVSQTRFVSVNAFVAFTRYVSAPEHSYGTPQYPDSPFGHQLLLTADNHLRSFDEDNRILSSEYHFLFPTSSSKFLHPDILLICLPSCRLLRRGNEIRRSFKSHAV